MALTDSYTVAPSVDKFTGAAIGISGDHAYIHKGLAFRAIGSATVNTGAETTLLLTTPAASVAYVHYRPASIASSASYVESTLYEGATVSGGTDGAEINCNRNSSITAGTVYKYGATYTSGGTIKGLQTVGSGGNPTARTGGSAGQDLELVLKPSTTYALRIVNPAGGANSVVSWTLFWYEEPEGVLA